MPKDNDLEGMQDMGGKHGGQAGMPKPQTRSAAQKAIERGDKDDDPDRPRASARRK